MTNWPAGPPRQWATETTTTETTTQRSSVTGEELELQSIQEIHGDQGRLRAGVREKLEKQREKGEGEWLTQ